DTHTQATWLPLAATFLLWLQVGGGLTSSSLDPMPASDTHQQIRSARPFQFTGRLRSFHHAICGIFRMIRCQHNAWIHAAATVTALIAAVFFRLSSTSLCWIVVGVLID